MQLRIGEKIDLAIGKAEVLGLVRFHTYTEYLIKMGPEKLWLEAGREWRLWKSVSPPFNPSNLLALFKETEDKSTLLGESLARLNWLIIREIGFAQALETKGEVEGTEPGDKVLYIEGEFPEKRGHEFNLFVAEVYGEEIECYEGREIEVRRT